MRHGAAPQVSRGAAGGDLGRGLKGGEIGGTSRTLSPGPHPCTTWPLGHHTPSCGLPTGSPSPCPPCPQPPAAYPAVDTLQVGEAGGRHLLALQGQRKPGQFEEQKNSGSEETEEPASVRAPGGTATCSSTRRWLTPRGR